MKIPKFVKPSIFALSCFLPCSACFGATAAELLKQGEVYDLKFKPTEALKYYLPAEKMEPENVDILLRIARQYRHQTADSSVAKEKIRLAGMGLSYAQRAVALAPKNSEAQLSNAICYAKSIDLCDNKEKMNALRQVRSYADRAIALDSQNDLAWYILARWHQRVAGLSSLKRKVAEIAYGGLPKATQDDAVKYFRKAISLNPGRSVYYVDMGISYAAMDNPQEARKSIVKGLSLPSTGKDDFETKSRGKEALKTLE